MTVSEPAPVTLPPGKAQHILDLLATSEAMLCVLKARGEHGENQLQASLEEISAHLTDGHDTGHLICLLKQAQRDLESLCLARPPTDPYRDGRDPEANARLWPIKRGGDCRPGGTGRPGWVPSGGRAQVHSEDDGALG